MLQVTSTNNPFRAQILPTTALGLTDAKVKKIGLGTLGTVCLIAGVGFVAAPFTFGVSGFVALAAIPFFLGTGLCVWQISTIRDYDSPKELEKYREQCASLTFENCLKEHGDYMFTRHLFGSQEEFTAKYQDYENTISSFKTVIAYRQKFEQDLRRLNCAYTLPPLNVLRYQKECETLTFEQIEKLHSLELVFTYKLLSPALFLEKYERHEASLPGLAGMMTLFYRTRAEQVRSHEGNNYPIPNPERHIPRIREECKTLALGDAIYKHGYEHLFRYNLLTPELFVTKYNEYTKHLLQSDGINAVLSFYQRTKAAYPVSNPISYEIPEPKYLSRLWHEKILENSATEILNTYNLSQLVELEILPKTSAYRELLLEMVHSKKTARTNCEKEQQEAQQRYERALAQIDNDSKAELDHLQNESALRGQTIRALNQANRALEQANNALVGPENEWQRKENNRKIAYNSQTIGRLQAESTSFLDRITQVEALVNNKKLEARKDKELATSAASKREQDSLAQLNQDHAKKRQDLVTAGKYFPVSA